MSEIALWLIAVMALAGAGLGLMNRLAISSIHKIMNSRLDELVKVSTEKAFLVGGEAAREVMAKQIAEASRKDSK